jgi:hypothetical protein
MPTIIETTVSSSVTTSPCRTRDEKKYCPTMSQPKRSFVTAERMSDAATSRTTAPVTHRHGWRTGTAVSSPASVLSSPRR